MGNEVNESVENSQSNEVNHYGIKYRILVLLSSTMMLSIMIALLMNMFLTVSGSDYYCKKDELKSVIKTIISNGADLDEVKHAFFTRNMENTSLFIKRREITEYYDKNVTLLRVLKDLQVDYHSQPPGRGLSSQSSVYYSQLCKIIDEYTKKTPFDELEEGQRALFENLQAKLGENYDTVQYDVSRISDALNAKNILTEKYLNKSNKSFTISIVALIVSVVFGILELWKPWRKRA